jgi:hypothetical protein
MALANFHGENALTIASFKPLTWCNRKKSLDLAVSMRLEELEPRAWGPGVQRGRLMKSPIYNYQDSSVQLCRLCTAPFQEAEHAALHL